MGTKIVPSLASEGTIPGSRSRFCGDRSCMWPKVLAIMARAAPRAGGCPRRPPPPLTFNRVQGGGQGEWGRKAEARETPLGAHPRIQCSPISPEAPPQPPTPTPTPPHPAEATFTFVNPKRGAGIAVPECHYLRAFRVISCGHPAGTRASCEHPAGILRASRCPNANIYALFV